MTDNVPIAVLGAGGHAKVIISTLLASGLTIAGVFDDDETKAGSRVLGVEVKGPLAYAQRLGLIRAIVAIGENATRQRIVESFDFEWARARHPTAWVDPSASIGAGTVLFAGTIVQADTRVGSHVIVNTAATIDHDCVVCDFAHLAPGSHLGGDVGIGRSSLIGLGASVKPGVSIGAGAVVGCGAVVISNADADARVVGVPARPLIGPGKS